MSEAWARALSAGFVQILMCLELSRPNPTPPRLRLAESDIARPTLPVRSPLVFQQEVSRTFALLKMERPSVQAGAASTARACAGCGSAANAAFFGSSNSIKCLSSVVLLKK